MIGLKLEWLIWHVLEASFVDTIRLATFLLITIKSQMKCYQFTDVRITFGNEKVRYIILLVSNLNMLHFKWDIIPKFGSIL